MMFLLTAKVSLLHRLRVCTVIKFFTGACLLYKGYLFKTGCKVSWIFFKCNTMLYEMYKCRIEMLNMECYVLNVMCQVRDLPTLPTF